ncbi:hypothetical protein N9F73_01160 [bacterium]|nr:hypothetical protein [bacterium]
MLLQAAGAAGCGVRVGGSSSSQPEAFFSELRVITLKTKKYSTLKTTTTAYPHHAVSPTEDSTRS